MTPETLRQMAKTATTLEELRAAVLIVTGDITPFDIQASLTRDGVKPPRLGRCEEAFVKGNKLVGTSCAYIDKSISASFKTTSMGARAVPTIARDLVALLAEVTARPLESRPRELKGINKALDLALKETRDSGLAERLLRAFIRTSAEELRNPKVLYPANLLPTLFQAYLAGRPKLTRDQREWAKHSGRVPFYNHVTKKWEKLP